MDTDLYEFDYSSRPYMVQHSISDCLFYYINNCTPSFENQKLTRTLLF